MVNLVQGLFERIADFDDSVARNIVSLRKSEDLFDDLHRGDPVLAEIAVTSEMAIKPDEPATVVDRGFHYATAILYPFKAENWLRTRYSDGRFPVWYGATHADTAMWETGYHAMKAELAVEGVSPIIHRERAVYTVNCRGLLIDITHKPADYPDLLSDDYGFCQTVGQRVQQEGHPGILAPSARLAGGTNVVVFRKTLLTDPRLNHYLTYLIDTRKRCITVQRKRGQTLTELDFSREAFW